MAIYYVNERPQSTGEHEVHTSTCSYLPSSRRTLGEHSTCSTAVAAAKRIFPKSDGCYFCARACHTR